MDVTALDAVPDDIGALRAALTAALARAEDKAAHAARPEAELAVAKAKASDDAALIAHQDLTIRKLQRAVFYYNWMSCAHGKCIEKSSGPVQSDAGSNCHRLASAGAIPAVTPGESNGIFSPF